ASLSSRPSPSKTVRTLPYPDPSTRYPRSISRSPLQFISLISPENQAKRRLDHIQAHAAPAPGRVRRGGGGGACKPSTGSVYPPRGPRAGREVGRDNRVNGTEIGIGQCTPRYEVAC